MTESHHQRAVPEPVDVVVRKLFDAMHERLDKLGIQDRTVHDLSDQLETLVSACCEPEPKNLDWHALRMTRTEARIMAMLYARIGRMVSRDAMMSALYFDRPEPPELKIIDVCVCRIRKRLAEAGAPYVVESIWGDGFRLVARA